MLIATATPSPDVTTQPRNDLRPEIQSLRALAVLAVVLYHLWPAQLPGGFVGVDVFFVVSGFLITSHLLREVNKDGTIRLGTFWARRAKRLLPAALTVLFACVIATIVFVPQYLWTQFLNEATAATLYVENWLLYANSVDYLAAENVASPVQHFWSLSVEEQFYIALPLIIVVTLALLRRSAVGTRVAALGAVLGTITVLSFAYSTWLTFNAPSESYFSTISRAWEFGAGALLAFAVVNPPRRLSRVVSVIGIAAIGAAALLYSDTTPFPGAAAALPVLGTLAVIWSGGSTVAGHAGSVRPIAWLAGISYSLYLWHWPLIILAPYVLPDGNIGTLDRLAILLASCVLATLTVRLIEDPVRFSPRLLGRARPLAIARWSALGMAVVVATGALALGAASISRSAEAPTIKAGLDGTVECLAESAPFSRDCGATMGASIAPALDALDDDDDNRQSCWSGPGVAEVKWCHLGPPREDASAHLLVVGDSHSSGLMGAYAAMADQHGWSIDVSGHSACYWTRARQPQSTAEATTACEEWRDGIEERIDAAPDLDGILVTHSSKRPYGVGADETIAGMVEAWAARPNTDVPVIAIRDNPRFPREVLDCIAEHQSKAEQGCARPKSEVLLDDGQGSAVQQSTNTHLIDLTDRYCNGDLCPPLVDNIVVYRDGHHLTATFVRTITPELSRQVAQLVNSK
ncbi:acyltransferase family protein [Agromyces sp. Marseille-Q5079]|uniref:acyltransferase family protein n=1 Tax=Agromyces sp. Marseille-Q5079 TaxID=3439059 RepID=UPI003D9C95BD